MHLQGVVLSWT